MSAITLPEYVSTSRPLDALGEAGTNGFEERITLWVPPKCFVTCGAIAHLVCWGQSVRGAGTQIRFDGDSSSAFYLSRMDVFHHLGFEFTESFERHDQTGRFTPARLVADSKDVFDVTNEILELILRQFDNAREFLPAVEWAANEIVDNVLLHSETPVPGVVCAQYFPGRHKLDIAVCDWGRGIHASMQPVLEPWEGVGAAVKKAVQRGVTRDDSVGQGNGLAGAMQITALNHGSFGIRTGDDVHRVKSGEEQGFRKVPEVPALRFSQDGHRNPVSMSDTILRQPRWTYFDQQANVLSETGRIKVVDEC